MVFFRSCLDRQCCLCGSTIKPTYEHKFKHSILKKYFDKGQLHIYEFGNIHPKFAQSSNSKYLKYSIPICESCNTHKTQAPDFTFDHLVKVLLEENMTLSGFLQLPEYEVGSKAYLDLFRYFSKLLCCHLAQEKVPIPLQLSRFAIGESDRNCIFLKEGEDELYTKINSFQKHSSDEAYMAHGGLCVHVDNDYRYVKKFSAQLSIKKVMFTFDYYLSTFERLMLRWRFPEAHNRFVSVAKQQNKK